MSDPLGDRGKIQATHLARLAFVYVRQSSPQQVRYKVMYRSTCKRREQRLTAAEIGALGAQGAPGDQGVRLPARATVRNGAGQPVGTLVSPFGQTLVASPLDGLALVMEISTSGVAGQTVTASDLGLFFENPGCTGQAFMNEDPSPLVRTARRAGVTVYYAGDPIDPSPRQYASREDTCQPGVPPNTPNGSCCTAVGFGVTAGPVRMFDVSVFGNPPFSVEP